MESGTPLDLTSQDLSSIEQYRLRRQTSVLVVLFTDIKDFTELSERRGDRHALELLRRHDAIVTAAVEAGGAGLVVKHIGDSVMAVFSEPSTAVERALRIQEEAAASNDAHPELEPLRIRIGMHMGQVAVENRTQLDLIGRHVNRASRVEALAGAGQIYLTYPVFDSARGWLREKAGHDLGWKLHGNYLLKGLEDPVAIYEVVDQRRRAPAAPKGCRRKAALLPLWLVLVGLLVGSAAVFAAMRYQRTEVQFVGWNKEATIIDQQQPLVLGGDPSQEMRPALTPLPPGRHLLQQDINWQVKNYMEVDIKRGLNVIRPELVSVYLPALGRRLDFEPGQEEQVEAHGTFAYALYDRANRRLDTKAEITVSIKGKPDEADPDLMVFNCTWTVVENGVVVNADSTVLRSRASDPESRIRTVAIHEGPLHYWYVRTFNNRWSAELEVGAAYIEYKIK